jgi:hypothetical protein
MAVSTAGKTYGTAKVALFGNLDDGHAGILLVPRAEATVVGTAFPYR